MRDDRKILGKWAITGTSIVMNIGGGQFQKEYQCLPSGTKTLVMS